MKKSTFLLSSLFVLLGSGVLLFAEVYPAGRATDITLDGVLDESCWAQAAAIMDFTLMKASGKTDPVNGTVAKILADDDALYFGVECASQFGVVAELPPEDVSNAWVDDLMEFFIAPTDSRDEYYQFAVTAGGAYWSQFFAESGNIRPDPYKPEIQIATKRKANGYSLEIRLPLHALYMTPGDKFSQNWAINLARYDIHKEGLPETENSTWAKLVNSFHEVQNFNTVSNLPRKPRKFDLLIPSVNFAFRGKTEEGFRGELKVDVVLNSAPAGEYTLETLGQTRKASLQPGANTIVLPAVFSQDGRVPVPLCLTNAQGEVVCKRTYPVFVDSTLYAIQFTTPQYGGNFYPGEDASRLRGAVAVNSGETEVVMTVAGKEYSLAVRNGHASFDLDVSDLTGDIPIAVGDIACTVKHVSDAKAWIRDGRIVVDGQASVRLGWYGGPSWICSHAVLEEFPTPASKQPITFPEWINLEPGRVVSWDVETKEMVFDQKPSEHTLECIKKAIQESQDNPAYVYYLCDEPECRGLSPIYLKHLYNFVKQQDPRRLVMIISREPVRYVDCCDIINPHPYISPSVYEDGSRKYGVTIQRLRDICASEEDLKRPDKALMLTPQVHSYCFNDYYADYPDFDETNVSVWSSVVHGGQGLTPFIWYEQFSRAAVDYGCDFLYDSLLCLSDFIAKGKRVLLPGDEAAQFTYGGDRLYVVCNVFPKARQFVLQTDCAKLYRFRKVGTLIPKGGVVTLELPPYGVEILTSKPFGTELEGEEALRKRIDASEEARCHRGNLLFGNKMKVRMRYPESQPYDWQNTMEQQDKMFDGNLRVSAWMPQKLAVENAWYEMEFTDGPKEFSTARIYGYNHQNLVLKIWDGAQWIAPPCTRVPDGKYGIALKFAAPLKTTQVRLEFQGAEVELYEFELVR